MCATPLSFCCADAGINAELEKANLLLPSRPQESSNNRHPADIYLPFWYGGRPAALDFAVTSPQQASVVGAASREPLHAAKTYSAHKRDYLNTGAACESQGVTFLPMVAETSGAWAPEAAVALNHLAKKAAARRVAETSHFYHNLLQRLSVQIRSSNARAHLKPQAA